MIRVIWEALFGITKASNKDKKRGPRANGTINKVPLKLRELESRIPIPTTSINAVTTKAGEQALSINFIGSSYTPSSCDLKLIMIE